MAVNKISVALIGAGGMARTHMISMTKTDHMVLRLVCDTNRMAAEQMAAHYGEPGCRICSDYREAIAAEGIDAVIIVTPNYLHHDILMAVIRAGKPYYIEKPIALTVNEALEMKTESEKKNIPNIVGFSYRFYPGFRYLKGLVDEGGIGEIRHIYSIYAHYPKPVPPRTWRFEKDKAGTGALGDLGAHTFDSLRLLAGEFDSVWGMGGIVVSERADPAGYGMMPVDTDDYFNAIIRMQSGAIATCSFSRLAYGRFNYQRYEIYGSEGALVYELEKAQEKIEVCIGDFYSDRYQFTPIDHTFAPYEIPPRHKPSLMQAFENVILGKDILGAGQIEDGYRVQQMIEAAAASAESGLWQKI
ncbi:MAG TPA: Gfo/Idh/MocA family oxidoreductase [Clostridiaceae bacterium]|nr:Gfo/Idh/MocA family oxidoreductase [Clostridiaceae bacterium]